MLNVMIVDDEPLAVNYLAESIAEMPHLLYNLIKAYSGKEALGKAAAEKIDILLTDIRMPGMNGIELADEILVRWPRCRVIFLTGYNDFDYVQTAIRKGGVDYVLKTEGDGAILAALEKAKVEIETEISDEHILQKARQQAHLALPSLRRDYLVDFLQGESESPAARRKRFAELGIELDPELPVYAMLGRIDKWGSFAAPADRVLLSYAIHNIAEEYLKTETRFVSFQYDRVRTVWLLQPKPGMSMESARQAQAANAERIQASCRTILNVPLSIALSSEPAGWEEAGAVIEDLKLQLIFCMADGEEAFVSGPASGKAEERHGSSELLLEIGRVRSSMHKLDLLETSMDSGDEHAFMKLYRELFQVRGEVFASEEGKWLGLELFSHMSAFFLTYLNKRKLVPALEETMALEGIYDPNSHQGLEAMMSYFGELGNRVSELNGIHRKERSHDIVERVNEYVQRFLREELSLTKLAEVVYLSPPYLSRLYKQVTGMGLLEHINETRVARGKLLLKQTDKKIHDIASEVGVESAPYFTRLFRKKTGMTPQEYRESSKGMEAL